MITVNEQNAASAAQDLKARQAPAKSLAEAMARVMERVSYVQKDKQMTGGGSYRYASVLEVFESKSGSRQNRTQVRYTFDLLHGPSGQTKPVVVIGEGMDVEDKSSNKAMTSARKYALVMAFNLEIGTDPDDTPSHEQQRGVPKGTADRDLVNRFEERFLACSTKPDFDQINGEIVECVRARTISKEGPSTSAARPRRA
jgi:hypothetical protein